MRCLASALVLATAEAQDLFLSAKVTGVQGNASCSVYKKSSDNCDQACGSCFNPGARAGVLCKGTSTGYFCPPDSPPAGSDMAFACMDWTLGSVSMKAAEAAFSKRSGDDVFFGVGTYGTAADVQRGLGNCYRMKIDGMEKEIIAQSINTGSDVSGNQFDLQIGDGGAGAFNTCAGGKNPGVDTMYPGTYEKSNWGNQYGGVDNREQCANLPKYPFADAAMKKAGDDLISLCQYGFDHGARQEGGGNPSILSIGRVKCPAELVEMTQIHRSDDPTSYTCGSDCTQAAHKCDLSRPGATAEWCLTRMMDCRKPSGGFKDNIKGEVMVDGHRLVQPCTSDGYTRIDMQCGCFDCYC